MSLALITQYCEKRLFGSHSFWCVKVIRALAFVKTLLFDLVLFVYMNCFVDLMSLYRCRGQPREV